MRQLVCTELGAPEKLSMADMPALPSPAPGMVTIACRAWGLNFVDLLMVAGGYQLKPSLPFVPGLEAAGIVTAVGEGVSDWREGDNVISAHRPGAFAEAVSVPATALMALPRGYSFAEGACFRSAFSTAYHGLVQGGRLQSGETVLIHGAAGGMGHAAIQVAKRLGAVIIATASSPAKRAKLKELYGIAHCLDATADDLRDRVKAATDGRGVDVVFDPVGGRLFTQSMRCLNYAARLVIVGFTDGQAASVQTNHILIKSASVIGIRAGEFSRHRPSLAALNMQKLVEWAEAGLIRPHISHEFAFSDFANAFNVLKSRDVIGRAVMVP